jgi:hypothetical protein
MAAAIVTLAQVKTVYPALSVSIGSEALALLAVMAASGIALAYQKHPPLAYAVALASGTSAALVVYKGMQPLVPIILPPS